MGAGSFPAGLGGAGYDVVYQPAAVAPAQSPRSLFYDPKIKQFVLVDANGSPMDVHPIDQIVAMRLTMYVGQSPSAVAVGTKFRAISSGFTPDRAQQMAKQEVDRVLRDLVQAGDVRVSAVSADVTVRGRVQIAVTYVNMRDPRNSQRYPTTMVANVGATNGA